MHADDIAMEVIDGRDSVAVILIRELDDGNLMSELKGVKVDKLTLAKLLYQLAKRLKAMHDSESDDLGPSA